MEELLRRLLPIFILLGIGSLTKKTKLLSEAAIDGLKTVIIKIALPAVLFDAFASMTLQVSYLFIFAIMFLFCCVLYFSGLALNRLFPKTFERYYTKGFMTGFEFGMIGVGLFGAIWGFDKLPIIMLIGFGHELFIWFFYVPLISRKEKGGFNLLDTLIQFVKTPTILAIIFGVIVNLASLYRLIGDSVIGGSLYATIAFLKPLTAPLILIVVGYTMVFKGGHLKEMAAYILARWTLVMGLGILVFIAIKAVIPNLDPLFTQAFFAFILLPAPYILPLYIPDQKEATFFTQLLVYSTVISFVGYSILVGMSF